MAGNRLDLDALYRHHKRMVVRGGLRLVSTDDAPELVAQVFRRAVEYQHTFRGDSSPVTWLYQITSRVCLHHLRDRDRRNRLVETWGMPLWSRPSPLPSTESRVFLAELWRILDEDLAEIGTYHYIDGLTHAEIALLLGCSRRTVGNRLAALRARVRDAASPSRETG